MKTGLLHPYPGSKKDWRKYPVWDEYQYDAGIEPFIGSGHFTHRMLANGRTKRGFVSDVDPAVSVVWEAWADTKEDEPTYGVGGCKRDYVEEFVWEYTNKLQHNLKLGKKKARMCIVCHGKDGLATNPEAPNLAGESAIYIEKQLVAFRKGERKHRQMTIIAQQLKDEDIKNLAAWYEAMKVTVELPNLDN